MYNAFVDAHPAKAFPLRDTGARNAYASEERRAYHSLIKEQIDFDKRYDPVITAYLEDVNRYKRIVDSLKLTLQ